MIVVDHCLITPATSHLLEPYKVFDVYRGIRLTLCHLCAIDFGSYQSAYFGFPDNRRIGYGHFNFVKEISRPQIVKDKYCPECDKRLNFLNFLIEIRQMNGSH